MGSEKNKVEKVIVVARSLNGVIGRDNGLPWSLPSDLQHFKKVTMGRPLIMGRKTYDSIGRPLPGRVTIVVTRQKDWKADGVIVVHSLDEGFIEAHREAIRLGVSQIMLVGGEQLYRQSISLIDRIILTLVQVNIEGDAHFPELDSVLWKQVSLEEYPQNDRDLFPYSFIEYERVADV